MLQALFAEMPDVRLEGVTILIATGTHRANTPDELVRMRALLSAYFAHVPSGTSDGSTAYLRTRHTEDTYAGIELEINQKLVGDAFWTPFCRDVACAMMRVAGKPDAFFSA